MRDIRNFLIPSILLITISTSAQSPSQPTAKSQASDDDVRAKLLRVKRLYVESFGDDGIAKQAQAMVIDAFTKSRRFIVTENKEKADAILKGTAIEKTSQELHSSSDATSVGAAAGGHESTWSGGTGSSNGGFIAKKMGIADAQASTETINDARLAVRLVSNDGDVLWSTTQESKGAKYKGAGADEADKVVNNFFGI
jgi:curli biogenesis system outer membrane secretion channel CsgG